ncbi:MAG: PQQ-binding-like beta-propeller repeat protein [Planctomycetes bacterium]|nr:PQQ-binding-like beta-propeller repeat protein [Planctomycetota bacterium]
MSHKVSKTTPPLRRLIPITIVIGLSIAAVLVARWYSQVGAIDRAIASGLELLSAAESPADVQAALHRWENETRETWQSRRGPFLARVFAAHSLSDRRIPLLLKRLTGVDYGDRPEDWRRWYSTQARLREGLQPEIGARKRVKLKKRWSAPIGLSAWYTTILPLDGNVYVGSLGRAIGDRVDNADGVVRVDGVTGHAELIFEPPGRGSRDIVGIAVGNGRLYVACRNGFLYCVSREGALLWEVSAGSAIVSAPMSIDLNSNGVSDAVVATARGEVVAISGSSGRTIWVSRGGRSASRLGRGGLVRVVLAAGDLLGGPEPEILVASESGGVRVLAARTGRRLWQHDNQRLLRAGAAMVASADMGIGPAFFGDDANTVWALSRSGDGLQAVPRWALSSSEAGGNVAGLRTLPASGSGTAELLACLSGRSGGRGGAICAIGRGGERWRYAPGGAIRGTPALADLNDDGQIEIIVASTSSRDERDETGVVTIVSRDGHCLHRLALDAAVECSPVIADVDGDGKLELLVADRSGRLHCFGTKGIGPVGWGMPGGDSHNTRNADNAYAFGQVPVGFQWKWRPKY